MEREGWEKACSCFLAIREWDFIIYFNLTWENDLGLSLKLRYLTHKFIHKIVIKTHFPMILHYP